MLKWLLPFCYCLSLIGSTIPLEQLPPPYNTVSLMEPKLEGWYSNHDCMQDLLQKFPIKTIVEVGSWMGVSTIDFAKMLPPEGKVFAVDTWNGSPNEHHDPLILRTLYDQFLSNIIHEGYTQKIFPIRMESLEAAQVIQEPIDLVYIDATHTYEACYADLQAWYPHIKASKGILCGDDWIWGDRGVERAVTQFAAEEQLEIHTNGWFWWLSPKSKIKH